MSHEPECAQRSIAAVLWQGLCICEFLRAAYRRGYNAHAASRQHAEAMFGPYTANPNHSWVDRRQYVIDSWNQHGKGENP